MSVYTEFLEKPNSNKITLVEIDLPEDTIFINYEPGIWFITYYVDEKNAIYNFGNGAFGYGNFGSAGVADLTNSNARDRIGSVWVEGEYYQKVTNKADLRDNNKSFYYDTSDFKLYIHFDNYDPPECFTYYKIGVTQGYATRAIYLDDIYYDARVISIPSISKSKDPLFFGVIHFEGGSIQLINVDGEFDNFANLNVFGQPCRILFGSPSFAYTDFETIFDVMIEDFSFDGGSLTLNVPDKRKVLSRKIPVNYFTTADYPDIKSTNAGKPIPLGYGVIDNAPAICTNEDGSTPFSFKICDTTNHSIKAITQVYVEGVAKTHGGEDLTNAVFTLTNTEYTAGDEVTVDFQGYETGGALIDNGLDIIEDLMLYFADVTYNSINYDTTEWAAEKANVKDMCLFIDSERTLIDVIGDICKSVPGTFLVQDDGLYTFKVYDSAKAPDREIKLMELLEPPRVRYESDEYLTSALIKYNKDWANDEWETVINDTEEADIFELYKSYRQRTFETLLVSNADAVTFGETIMDLAGEIHPTFTIKTKTQNINLEIEDVVDIEVYIFSDGTYGTVRCELIGIEKNLMEYTVNLTLKHIEDVTSGLSAATIVKWISN